MIEPEEFWIFVGLMGLVLFWPARWDPAILWKERRMRKARKKEKANGKVR